MALPCRRRRRGRSSRALPRSTPEQRSFVNALWRSRSSRALPRSTPEQGLFVNAPSQSCLTSFDHVPAVLVIVEHLSARWEVSLFVHGAHLRVGGCIMLQPLPSRQISLHFASTWPCEGRVQTHLVGRQEGLLSLEGSISALGKHMFANACQGKESYLANRAS